MQFVLCINKHSDIKIKRAFSGLLEFLHSAHDQGDVQNKKIYITSNLSILMIHLSTGQGTLSCPCLSLKNEKQQCPTRASHHLTLQDMDNRDQRVHETDGTLIELFWFYRGYIRQILCFQFYPKKFQGLYYYFCVTVEYILIL